MRTFPMMVGLAAVLCAAGMPSGVSAAVSDADFNSLKDLVTQQGQKIEQLQETHAQDQQQIQNLQMELGITQVMATNAVQSAAVATQTANSAASQAGQAQVVFPTPNPVTSAKHNFMMVGDAEIQFGKTDGQHGTFSLADFAPIFLYQANENVLFEAGFDIMLNNNANADGTRAPGSSTSVSLSFAQLDYLYNDYVTFVGGEMLLPLGTYAERGAGWLNKIPDDPLARDLLPGSGVGVQLRGAAPIGEGGQMITYSVYGVNGPSSGSATNTANAADLDLGGNVGSSQNWHSNPSGGGRVGWFYPWKLHYDLELGISGQSGQWSDSGNRWWTAGVLDAALHLGPYFEAKGEYINTWVQTDDLGTLRPHGLWAQASYKLAGLNLNSPFIDNVELVGRYDNEDDAQGTKTDRYTFGYVYYFSNTLLFEGDYERLASHGPNSLPANAYVLQLSYGF